MTAGEPAGKPVARWIRPSQVVKELRGLGLSRDEAARLGVVMDRVARGEAMPADLTKLKGRPARGIEEVRVRINRRIARLYFARPDGDLVLLALHVHIKKTNNDRPAVDLAIERLRKYKRGEWGVDH